MAERAPRWSPAEIEETRARIPLAELVGRRVKLQRSGRNLVGLCPFHGEKTPSFYVYPGADQHFHCFGCGAGRDAIDFVMKISGLSFQDAVSDLRGEAGLDAGKPAPPANRETAPSPAPRETPANKNLAFAAAIFKESRRTDPILDAYANFRGITLPRVGVIRFHPACPRGLAGGGQPGERLPAMVALMTDPVTNKFVGVHRTFLRPDGLGKVEHGKAKMMLGGAGVIRLAPDSEITMGLGICEGIETGLALMKHAGWSAIWAAGNSGAMDKFPVLAGIECLTLFPDLDDSGAGRLAAETCTARWVEAGRETQTIWPPGGLDWNDVLVRRAA